MPFVSKAQRRWMYANEPEMAKRWEKHTKSKNLPDKVEENEVPRMNEVFKIKEAVPTLSRKERVPPSALTAAGKTASKIAQDATRAGGHLYKGTMKIGGTEVPVTGIEKDREFYQLEPGSGGNFVKVKKPGQGTTTTTSSGPQTNVPGLVP